MSSCKLLQRPGMRKDMAVCNMLQKTLKAADLALASHSKPEPVFLFKDGCVTKAAKLGQTLILEDLDLASQGVMERLNPLLETSPSYAVTEDVTLSARDATGRLPFPQEGNES